jgi:hypothetical protein
MKTITITSGLSETVWDHKPNDIEIHTYGENKQITTHHEHPGSETQLAFMIVTEALLHSVQFAREARADVVEIVVNNAYVHLVLEQGMKTSTKVFNYAKEAIQAKDAVRKARLSLRLVLQV